MKSEKKILMTEEDMSLALKEIAVQIKRQHKSFIGVVLIGIKRRGDSLAKKLAAHIKEMFDSYVSIGSIKIELYKDDLTDKYREPKVKSVDLKLDEVKLKNAIVIIVDDVVWTGRTAFRATNILLKKGARQVEVCCLVDRTGHRLRPLLIQYCGLCLPTAKDEQVEVSCVEDDGDDLVNLLRIKET